MRKYLKLLFLAFFLAAALAIIPGAQSCGLLPQPLAQQISTSEPWYCPINQQVYGQWSASLPTALVVVFLSFMIAGIIFMVGVVFNSRKITNFGIGEFYEAIVTAIIVAAFLYLCAVVFGILPAVLVGDINPYVTAFNLITSTIQSAQSMYQAIFNVYFSVSSAVSLTVTVQAGGAFGQLAQSLFKNAPEVIKNFIALPAQLFFLDPAFAISRFLVDGILALYAEYYLMVFFSVAAIPGFLIPGIFFRAIFPTRALGGILIAMAIGFYLIMPSLFAVAFYFTAPSLQNNMATVTFQIQNLGAQNNLNNAASPSSPLAVNIQNVKSSLNGFWLLIFFYPALIVAITYTSINELSNFIGKAQPRFGQMRRFI